jgi:hypothetical protein
MNDIQPQTLNVLYAIKAMAEVHRQLLLERHFKRTSDRLKHAEHVLKRVYQYSDSALREAAQESKHS